MTAKLSFMGNQDNVLPGAVITALNTLPSSSIFVLSRSKKGTGAILLSGPYTGQKDTTINVVITSDTTGTPTISVPTPLGVGNGIIEALSADAGTPAQEITLTLQETGSTDAFALIQILNVFLQWKIIGTPGNLAVLQVIETGIVFTPSGSALLENWAAGVGSQTGSQWDFGGFPLLADGTLSSATSRISFGTNEIFRQYKTTDSQGKPVFHLTPIPTVNIPIGAIVSVVTGTKSVIIGDGFSAEIFTGVVTVFDFFDKVNSTGTLVVSQGLVSNNRLPGGMGVIDFPLTTDAFFLPVVNTGSKFVDGLDGITVGSNSFTEKISIVCLDNNIVTQEKWSVTGSVSGVLPDAITGVAFLEENNRFGFTIPIRIPDAGNNPLGAISLTANLQNENEIEFRRALVGSNAQPESFTFVWTKRPDGACNTESITFTGGPKEECLGIIIPEEEIMTISAGLAVRRQKLSQVQNDSNIANTRLDDEGEITSHKEDIQLTNDGAAILASCLVDIYGSDAVLSWIPWAPAVNITLDERREPIIRNGFKYRAVQDGVTGLVQPPFPMIIGALQADGTTGWENIGKTPEAGWDDVLEDYKGHMLSLADFNQLTAQIQSPLLDPITLFGSTPTVGDYYMSHVPTATNGVPQRVIFRCVKAGPIPAGILFSDFPVTVKMSSNINVDGAVTDAWFQMIGFRQTQARGDISQVAGKANSTFLPPIGFPGSVNDEYQRTIGLGNIPRFLNRYIEQCNLVRSSAELNPFDNPTPGNTASSECWTDVGDDFFWDHSGGQLRPIFNGVYYHSSIIVVDEDGNKSIQPTNQFAGVVLTGCIDRLVEGDTITITINGAGGFNSYQISDQFDLSLVQGGDIPFLGGIDGDNLHTWGVFGSVDGQLPSYVVEDGAELPYAPGGGPKPHFTIKRGTIDNIIGDRWKFFVQVGEFKWQQDSLPFSVPAPIPTTTTSLVDGLLLDFVNGPGKSFVTNDSILFSVRQFFGPAQIHTSNGFSGQWTGSDETYVAILPSSKNIRAVGIGLYSDLVDFEIDFSDDGGSNFFLGTEIINIPDERVVVKIFSTNYLANAVRIRITNSPSGKLGWIWLGDPLTLSKPVSALNYSKVWNISRSGRGGATFGKGFNYDVSWDLLTKTDIVNIQSLLDDSMTNNLAPIIINPNEDFVDLSSLVQPSQDQNTVNEFRQLHHAQGVFVANTQLLLQSFLEEN